MRLKKTILIWLKSIAVIPIIIFFLLIEGAIEVRWWLISLFIKPSSDDLDGDYDWTDGH